MSKIKIVAITGRSGSGKSSLAEYFANKGFAVANGDEIARSVVQHGEPILAELARHFGKDILDKNGELKRKELAEKAFSSPEQTHALNNITHPEIIEKIARQANIAQANGEKLFFVDAAVVVGGFLEEYCDIIIVVSAPQKQSLDRIVKRDNISIERAKKRQSAQMPCKTLKKAADFVIINNKDTAHLYRQADNVLEYLLNAANS